METSLVAKRRWRWPRGPRSSFLAWLGYLSIALFGMGVPFLFLMRHGSGDGTVLVLWNLGLITLQGLAAFLEIPGLVRQMATPPAHDPVTARERLAERDRRDLPKVVRRSYRGGLISLGLVAVGALAMSLLHILGAEELPALATAVWIAAFVALWIGYRHARRALAAAGPLVLARRVAVS